VNILRARNPWLRTTLALGAGLLLLSVGTNLFAAKQQERGKSGRARACYDCHADS